MAPFFVVMHELVHLYELFMLIATWPSGAGLIASGEHATDIHVDVEDDHGQGQCIWTMNDLRILHEIQKPVAIVVAGAYTDPHR